MSNMGLSDLVIAGALPEDLTEARKMACWATPLLESCRVVPTLSEATADCTMVIGATARSGLYRQHAKTPREWASTIIKSAKTGKVALLFGPEDNGLSNTEIGFCSHLVHIPSSTEYSSLNLAHAVMICAYELFLIGKKFEPLNEKSPIATCHLKERMFGLWETALKAIGFMTSDKTQHVMLGIRRIFSRNNLTENDVRILMGIAQQAKWCATELEKQKENGLTKNKKL